MMRDRGREDKTVVAVRGFRIGWLVIVQRYHFGMDRAGAEGSLVGTHADVYRLRDRRGMLFDPHHLTFFLGDHDVTDRVLAPFDAKRDLRRAVRVNLAVGRQIHGRDNIRVHPVFV